MITLLLLSVPALAEQDVLVPEFTPATVSDYAVSYLIYDSLVFELKDRGVDVVDADQIRSSAGDKGDACAEIETCPGELFDFFPARLAVVGRVEQTPGGLAVKVEIHDANNGPPVQTLDEVVPSGEEYAFTSKIADTLQELLPLVQPRSEVAPPPPPPEESFSDLDQVLDDAFSDPPPEEVTAHTHEELLPPEEERPSSSREDEERRMLGVGARAYADYRRANTTMDLWASDVRLRSYQFSFEVAGGLGIGNVADAYDVRVAFDANAGDTLDTYESRALGGGASFQTAIAAGYHPRAWVETGLLLGFQRATKDLSVGWESYNAGQMVDSYEYTYDPAGSWQALIEPRARFYALTTGIVKPYGLAAMGVRIVDGYEVPESGLVDYPDVETSTILDAVLGAGTMLDLTENFSFFLEIPFGFALSGAGATAVESERLSETPTANEPSRTLMRLSTGLQTRF